MQIADSLYRQVIFIFWQFIIIYYNQKKKLFKVTNMWHSHLKEVVLKKTEISDLDSILGKNDDQDMDNDSIGNI